MNPNPNSTPQITTTAANTSAGLPTGYVAPTSNQAAPGSVPNAAVGTTYATQAAALAALGGQTGDQSLIGSNNQMGQDGLLRPFDHNYAGRGASYGTPNPYVDVRLINATDANNGGYNQLMMEVAQHFDPMIQISTTDHPRWWHDRIPRTSYKLFDGASHETTIFRGGLYTYSGLKRWQPIASTPYAAGGQAAGSAAVDPCAPLPFETVKYGWERLSWTGRRTAWGSDPICLDMFKYFTQATQQLAWILSVGAEEAIEIQEVWNRDMFIYQSVAFGRSFVMNDTFSSQQDSVKYWYNPFADPSLISDTALKTAVDGHAYIVFPADEGKLPTALNFDVLDRVRESLKVRCPRAAVSNVGGEPMFALTVSHDDVERYVRGNEEERRYWVEANPQALIKGYDFVSTPFRRWVITNDNNQIRFTIVGKITVGTAAGTNDAATLLGDPQATSDKLPAGNYFVAKAVDPLIASPTRIGVNGSPIPEDNPEYYTAELAIGCVFMNHVFTNQFVPDVTTLGSGTHFGPVKGLNGQWGWLNILDREKNPLGNVGNFYGRFEVFPKPELHVVHTTSFLYKRCTTVLPSVCPTENIKLFSDFAGTGDTVKTVGATTFAQNSYVATVTLTKAFQGVGIGSQLAIGGATYTVVATPGTRTYTLQRESASQASTIAAETEVTVGPAAAASEESGSGTGT